MRVLVACEESQAVCIAFRNKGHEAYSCDLKPCSGGHPEWHIVQDVVPLLKGDCSFESGDGRSHYVDKWDIIIAFPPCTYLSNAGARHLYPGNVLNKHRAELGLEARKFFMLFYTCGCKHIAIENPVPNKAFGLPRKTQEIQPWEFGHPCTKKTYLWLRGLPKLVPTNPVRPIETTRTKGGWFNKGGKTRQINRAKTFQGIAEAMAEQWGGIV